MNWQQIISLAIVALAAGLLLWGRFRPRKFSFQRDTHCGCQGGRTGERSSIVYSAKKGGRPRVTVKMR